MEHVQVLHDVCLQMNLDPQEQTPGRKGLGLQAVLPPPEEEKQVRSASAQAGVEQQRRSTETEALRPRNRCH